jgi:hypothetical protein
LQTPAYIRALMAIGSREPEWRERALRARLQRQRILERDDGTVPKLIALITEASLLYAWGGADDRRAQIEHLAEMSRRPDIELRLLRFGDGLHPGMSTLVNIFEFPGSAPPLVFLENDARIQEINTPGDVEAYGRIFEQVREAALGTADTTSYLDELKDELE